MAMKGASASALSHDIDLAIPELCSFFATKLIIGILTPHNPAMKCQDQGPQYAQGFSRIPLIVKIRWSHGKPFSQIFTLFW